LEEIDRCREKLIKQKEEYEKWKNEEGDSDLMINQKDGKKKSDL